VQLLLEKGADVHAADINGETALMAAAEKENTTIVKMLLEKGKSKGTAKEILLPFIKAQ
jgi:ankyrin repeat protein